MLRNAKIRLAAALAVGALLGYLGGVGSEDHCRSTNLDQRHVRMAAAAGARRSAVSADAVGEYCRPHHAGFGVSAAG